MEDPWATVDALAADTELGASEMAGRAARILPAFSPDELPDAIETLLRGHPQMAPLWRLASDLLSSSDPTTGAEWFLGRQAEDANAVNVLAPILPDEILTISYSSTVKEAIRMRQPKKVLCMSSDPGGEGLQMMGSVSGYTEASVIKDAEALKKVPAQAVVVGADAITPTSLVNKVKTRQLAEAARKKSVPCFALAGETKFFPAELPLDDRFQPTSLDLFSGIATPMGLITPSEATMYATDVKLHPALAMLVERIGEPEEPSEGPAS